MKLHVKKSLQVTEVYIISHNADYFSQLHTGIWYSTKQKTRITREKSRGTEIFG